MNHTVSKKDALEALAQKQRIMHPEPPKPRIDAIVVKTGDRMLGGKIRHEGEILLVFNPEEIPAGFVSKASAEELVENGYCDRATPAQLEAFLEAQNPSTADQ